MKLKPILLRVIIFSTLMSNSAFAQSYEDFLKDVVQESVSIKIAQNAIEVEKERAFAQHYFYAPELISTSELTTEKKVGLDATDKTEITLKATMKLYSSDTIHKIDSAEYNVLSAYNGLYIEKEKISVAILKNLVNIHFYQKLKDFAFELNSASSELSQRLDVQYRNGTASENDVKRTELLINQIDNEINMIDKQIKLSISNIEGVTGIPYPSDGIHLDNVLITKIIDFEASEIELSNNLIYVALRLQKDIARSLVEQQDPLFTLSLSGETTYKEEKEWINDSKITVSGQVNIFNINKHQEKQALARGVETSLLQMDLKMLELKNNLSTYYLLENSYIQELQNLEEQIRQTNDLITAHPNEYVVGKVSLYEMLNTRFDLFTATKQKTDIEVQFAQNKIDMMQATGRL